MMNLVGVPVHLLNVSSFLLFETIRTVPNVSLYYTLSLHPTFSSFFRCVSLKTSLKTPMNHETIGTVPNVSPTALQIKCGAESTVPVAIRSIGAETLGCVAVGVVAITSPNDARVSITATLDRRILCGPLVTI